MNNLGFCEPAHSFCFPFRDIFFKKVCTQACKTTVAKLQGRLRLPSKTGSTEFCVLYFRLDYHSRPSNIPRFRFSSSRLRAIMPCHYAGILQFRWYLRFAFNDWLTTRNRKGDYAGQVYAAYVHLGSFF
eukprot:1147995-Pelagomonas_calceolata.AAC.4